MQWQSFLMISFFPLTRSSVVHWSAAVCSSIEWGGGKDGRDYGWQFPITRSHQNAQLCLQLLLQGKPILAAGSCLLLFSSVYNKDTIIDSILLSVICTVYCTIGRVLWQKFGATYMKRELTPVGSRKIQKKFSGWELGPHLCVKVRFIKSLHKSHFFENCDFWPTWPLIKVDKFLLMWPFNYQGWPMHKEIQKNLHSVLPRWHPKILSFM